MENTYKARQLTALVICLVAIIGIYTLNTYIPTRPKIQVKILDYKMRYDPPKMIHPLGKKAPERKVIL